MDIERPLDDFVKESLKAKKAAKAEARKKSNVSRPTKKVTPTPPTAPAPSAPDSSASAPKHTDALRRRVGIVKKRRTRRRPAPPPTEPPSRKSTAPTPAARPVAAPVVAAPPAPFVSPRDRSVKVAVSNLHVGVTQDDITELFETVGPLQSATLHRLPNGASAGEAEVVFEHMPDALEAIKRYNLVPLDNQPLHITLVTNHTTARGRRPTSTKVRGDGDYRALGGRAASPPPRTDATQDDRFAPNGNVSPSPPPNDDRHPPRRQRGRRNRRGYNRQSAAVNDDRQRSPDRPDRRAYMD